MNIAGIIAEYNPLHHGHLYLLQQARVRCEAEYVICVMSASFVQRGEPAMHDKFSRTTAALAAGADMVLELPCAYSLQAAEYFSSGAVRTLAATGAVTHLVFGAETPDALDSKAPDQREVLAKLDAGVPYAAAACADTAAIQFPNNLLGIEYMRAIKQCGSYMVPVAVARIGAEHGSVQDASFSATASRGLFESRQVEKALASLPWESASVLGKAPICLTESAFVPLLCRLRAMTPEALRGIAGIGEGLEYRVLSAAEEATSLDDLIKRVKSKRYTYSRIARLLMSALIGLTAEETARANKAVPYVRVLGMKESAAPLLSVISKQCTAPLIVRVQDALKSEQSGLLRRETVATDVRAALCTPIQAAKRDKTAGIIIR